MFEAVGLTVSRLMRVRYGPVQMPPRLKRGMTLELSPEEVKKLIRQLPAASPASTSAPVPEAAAKPAKTSAPGTAPAALPRTRRGGAAGDKRSGGRRERPAR